MPLKTAAWKCEHCNMTSVYKYNVARHERDYCQSNPARRSCHSCTHHGVDVFIMDRYSDGERVDICALALDPVEGKRGGCDGWEGEES